MKFGNVSTLLLTLSPWYESYAVVGNVIIVVGENGGGIAPRSNRVLPEIADNAIPFSPTLAPPRTTATTLPTSSKHFKLIHQHTKIRPEVNATGIGSGGSRKKSTKFGGGGGDSNSIADQRNRYPAEPILYVGGGGAAIGDVTTVTSGASSTRGSVTSPAEEATRRPMIAASVATDSGNRSADNLTDSLERRLLDSTEYNVTTVATLTSWDDDNNTLSYAWNFTATTADEFQTQVSNLTSVVYSTAQPGSDAGSAAIGDSAGFEFGDTAARSAALAVLLALFCAFTVFGNVLVMAAVARERYLHTVTNYFVVSLATADCLVGALVMPFSVVHETMSRVWIFGRDWCDVWHSLDVLASTASILNLCVISLDRYWAITDPITYPSKMTTKRAVILIAVVWVCSSLISFPAIAWWRAVSPTLITTITTITEDDDEQSPTTITSDTDWPHVSYYSSVAAVLPPSLVVGPACIFTNDIGYLVFSSIISFYGPLTVMVFTYYRIYRAAAEQTRSLRLGTKQVLACNGEESMELTLRIHRGGGGGSGGSSAASSCPPAHVNGSGGGRRGYHPSSPLYSGGQAGEYHQQERGSGGDSNSSCSSSVRVVPKNLKHFSFSRKLARLAKEQKAAKTLGIVMGVFVLCWMPFFLCNVLLGLCPESCFRDPELVSSVVTWLGWINSGMNPVIYACWSRDFRRAFTKILCGCCPRLMVLDGGVAGGHRTMRHRLRSRVCQSAGTPMSSACSAECVRL